MDKILYISETDAIPAEVVEALDQYQIVNTSAEFAAVQEAAAYSAKTLLLDMENRSAIFELCGALANEESLKDIPVLLLSSNTDPMIAFEAGADDFLLKPYEPAFLQTKVLLLLHNFNLIQGLKKRQKDAASVALQALRSTSELGLAMHFIEQCAHLTQEEQIAQELINACNNFGLKVVVSILRGKEWFITGSNVTVSPIEQDIVPRLHGVGRFVDFGNRTQVNFPHIALLVKNMPQDEPDRYGRIKDVLPYMLGAVDTRLLNLREARAVHEQTELMSRSFAAMFPVLQIICERLNTVSLSNKSAMAELLEYMFVTVPKMGLDEDQEEFVIRSIEQISDFSQQLSEESAKINEQLGKVSKVLEKLMLQQKYIDHLSDELVEVPTDS